MLQDIKVQLCMSMFVQNRIHCVPGTFFETRALTMLYSACWYIDDCLIKNDVVFSSGELRAPSPVPTTTFYSIHEKWILVKIY